MIYAGAITLLFGGFLGGVLKLMLDEVVAANRRKDDAAGFVTRVLADLKGVYDRVARAKIVIPAHKSAKTYGEEMRDLIEARVQLLNVIRALKSHAEGVREVTRGEGVQLVGKMEEYLESLTTEFRDNYKELSDRQRGYEARAEVMVEAFAKEERGEPPAMPAFVWTSISRMKMLSDLIADGPAYTEEFEKPLDTASERLREELAYILNPSRKGP